MSASTQLAKVIVLSSLVTLVIVGGVVFLSRDFLAAYATSQILSPTPPAPVASTEEKIITAVERVNPSVVSVVVTKDVPVYERYYETFNPWGFFGGFTVPRVRENGTEEREVGGGTGFIINQEGIIVTNHHVVADPESRYSILLYNGTSFPVDVLASDPEIDIAVLKIAGPIGVDLDTAVFGNATRLKQGQSVIAIGNALAEFQNSVSVGVISGLSRSIVATDSSGSVEELHQVIQTDAAINPGNSGGPLLNIDGEVIGVNVATSKGADNIGFAIPADMVEYVVESVLEYGKIIKPYLGVRYTTVTKQLAAISNLPSEYGALLVTGENQEPAVLPGSPAEEIGLLAGDIIIGINGMSLNAVDLDRVLRQQPIGELISIEIIREGEYLLKEVTLSSI